MSSIVRPAKTGGNQTYVAEIADGNIHIKAAEVDDDFNTIYNDYANNINNDNIAASAGISTSKIAQDQGLQTDHYADQSVTSAKIADGTIQAVDLAPGAVTTTSIIDDSITINKLKAGASIRHIEEKSDTNIVVTTTSTEALAHTSFTPKGAASTIQVTVTCQGFITANAPDITVQPALRLLRDAVQIDAVTARFVWPAAVPVTMNGTEIPFALTITTYVTGLTAATIFSVNLQKAEAGAGTNIVTVDYVRSLLVEHA